MRVQTIVVVRSRLRRRTYAALKPPQDKASESKTTCGPFFRRLLLVLAVTTLLTAAAIFTLHRLASWHPPATWWETLAREVSLGSLVVSASLALIAIATRESEGCKFAEWLKKWLEDHKPHQGTHPAAGKAVAGWFGGGLLNASTQAGAAALAIAAASNALPPNPPSSANDTTTEVFPPVVLVAPASAPAVSVAPAKVELHPVVQAGEVKVPAPMVEVVSDPRLVDVVNELIKQSRKTDERIEQIHTEAALQQDRLHRLAVETGALDRYLSAVEVNANAAGYTRPTPLDARTAPAPVEVPAQGDDVMNAQRARRPTRQGVPAPTLTRTTETATTN